MNAAFPNHKYGCTIQTGKALTRHVVYGRDPLSALAHAILALEKFLSVISSDYELYELDGKPFEPSTDLVMFGMMGKRYMKGDKAKRIPGTK
jgi:hypothetical protein